MPNDGVFSLAMAVTNAWATRLKLYTKQLQMTGIELMALGTQEAGGMLAMKMMAA